MPDSEPSIDQRVDALLTAVGIRDEERRMRVRSILSAAIGLADDDGRNALSEFVGSCSRRVKRRRGEVVDLTSSPSPTDHRWDTALSLLRANFRVPAYPVLMTDQSYFGLEEIMNAWLRHNDVSERFEDPFRMVAGGPLHTISQDFGQVDRNASVLQALGDIDSGLFFELHVRSNNDSVTAWRSLGALMHLAFAKVVVNYMKRDTDNFLVAGVYVKNLLFAGHGIQVSISHRQHRGERKRVIALQMVRRVGALPGEIVVAGSARLTFKNYVVGRRVLPNFIFPTVPVHERPQEESDCPICLTPVTLDVMFSGCGHRIHDACLAAMHIQVCYLCRAPFFVPGDAA